MSGKNKKIIIGLVIILIVLGIIVFSGNGATDADVMIVDNKSALASDAQIKKFLNDFVTAIKEHDKVKFLSLFSKNSAVEDPVGIEPYKDREEDDPSRIEIFYDTNLAESDVTFISHEDIICGMDVVRDAVVKISPEPGVVISVDAYSFYQLTLEDGRVKMNYLRAFWEMDSMNEQMMDFGITGIKIYMAMTWNVIKNQGFSGMTGFLKGMTGIHEEGKESVNSFVEAVNKNESGLFLALFKDKGVKIKYQGTKKEYSAENYISGPGKNTEIAVSGLRSAGWYTACRFNLAQAGSKKHGVAIFQFGPESKKITEVRFYYN